MSFYTPSIPQSGDDPKVSQAQILGNFSRLNSDFNEDHISFSSTVNRGQHRKVTFQNVLGSDPDKSANIASLYTKTFAAAPELFFQNNNTANDVFQLTNIAVPNTGTNWTFVTPWGLQVMIGQSTGGTITFHAGGFPVGTGLLTAVLTGIAANNPKISTFTITGMTYTPAQSVYYMAIGALP